MQTIFPADTNWLQTIITIKPRIHHGVGSPSSKSDLFSSFNFIAYPLSTLQYLYVSLDLTHIYRKEDNFCDLLLDSLGDKNSTFSLIG